jgi:hypothetical protein
VVDVVLLFLQVDVFGQAKISQFDRVPPGIFAAAALGFLQQHVGQFNVTVVDVVAVQVGQGLDQFFDVGTDQALGQLALLAQQLCTITSLAQFQHDVDVVVVFKIIVILHNVGVFATAVDGHFVFNQFDQVVLGQALFGDLFEGDTGGRESEGGRPVDNGKTTFAELVFSHEGMHGGVLLVVCCGVGAAVLNHHNPGTRQKM